jgi:hypothetical protein
MKRFWDKVDKNGPNGCWNWIGFKHKYGYGYFTVGSSKDGTRRKARAHRFVMGEPKGKVVMHTCDNTSCVNPAHLRIGTQTDNMRDMYDKKRAWFQQATAT